MHIADNDAAYLACRSLCEGLVGAGISDAVVSPGSRSMPLALTVDATAGLRTWVRIDERSAGYFALGLAKGSGRPVVLVCTSGTAAANYLPAVVEAHYSGVPLVVLTADRPPELRGWGAGQTIDQHSLYGSHVRWFCETPVASELPVADAVRWFGVAAARAVTLALGMNPGPVHLNVPFREPLEPVGSIDGVASPGVSGGEGQCSAPAIQQVATSQIPAPPLPIRTFVPGTGFGVSAGDAVELVAFARGRARGVVVAGPWWDGDRWAEAVAAFCRASGWPLLAEPCSQLRRELDGVVVTDHHDLLLRTAWADAEPPEAVLRVGGAPTCKPLRLWIERHRPAFALVDPAGGWTDASFSVSLHLRAGPAALADAAAQLSPAGSAWGQRWASGDARAAAAIDGLLDGEPLAEAGVARQLGRSLPEGCALFVSNSMPVRDVDSYLRARAEPLAVHANRGASGIDGVISAATGVAASGAPTTVLIGDLAFRHDLGGLVGAFDSGTGGLDLTVVVVDNGGGTIFSFLPAHGVVDSGAFDRVLTTPPKHSSAEMARGLAEAMGFEHHHVTSCDQLGSLLASHEPGRGLRVVTIDIDADANRDQHRRLADAVERAIADGEAGER
ncbi:2-succinyl-5-enolpyruvyl-6-hydroxy-3-cyclohexene-1-carboxylic-acid synthase [Candidatus Poriferisodalis sp.]|uniref:2-succinyl-5-enolpyruvyl-6-hydroxy-3- cyclohexene-1-carboxylic-acid synthase n=1 Tax=Candidatus Poriferisodalis sp. TaxID=3101277 RepID=UPI003B01255E